LSHINANLPAFQGVVNADQLRVIERQLQLKQVLFLQGKQSASPHFFNQVFESRGNAHKLLLPYYSILIFLFDKIN